MTRKSALIYVIGFFCSYATVLFSAMTESISLIIIALSVFGVYIIITIYIFRKYGARVYNNAHPHGVFVIDLSKQLGS